MENNEIFYYAEEKLQYVIKYLDLKVKDIASSLELSSAMISQIQNHTTGKLKRHHLYAIAHVYNIPMEIFDNESINTPSLIKSFLNFSKNDEEKLFYKNEKLANNLLGEWYLYSYPSNLNHSKIYETHHTIYADGTVKDEHNNQGKLYLGKNQSLIVKESNNSKNLTSITFDNNRVTYNFFIFSRVSKSINMNQELFNFGFFSKKQLTIEEVTGILGEPNQVQMKLDYSLLERLNQHIRI